MADINRPKSGNRALGYFGESAVVDFLTNRGTVILDRNWRIKEGEIDIVASPNLTEPGFVEGDLLGHLVRLETDIEIVAKKMWHRGDQVKARDLLDLSLVIERSPEALHSAANFLIRHRDAFLEQLISREDILREQFNAIDTIKYRTTFDEAADVARRFLLGLTRV